MKKIIIFFIVVVSFVHAEKKVDFKELQNFYYTQGYNVCMAKVYDKALENAKKALEAKLVKYKQQQLAYEASKYLMKEGKITYPETIKVPDDNGNFKYIIIPSKITGKLTIKDIWKIPTVYDYHDKRINNNDDGEESTINNKYGFSLPSEAFVDKKNYTSYNNKEFYSIDSYPKKAEYIKAAEDMNIPFSLNPKTITISFKTNKIKQDFCYKVTGDEKCYQK